MDYANQIEFDPLGPAIANNNDQKNDSFDPFASNVNEDTDPVIPETIPDSPPAPDVNSPIDSLFFIDAPELMDVTAGGILPQKAVPLANDSKKQANINRNENKTSEPAAGQITAVNKNNIEIIVNPSHCNLRNPGILFYPDKAENSNQGSYKFDDNFMSDNKNEVVDVENELPNHWDLSFMYEPEGRPWWMPINVPEDKPRSTSVPVHISGDGENQIASKRNLLKKQSDHKLQQAEIEAQRTIDDLNANENMDEQDNEKRKRTMVLANTIAEAKSRKKQDLVIDFNVIIRKFILFTSIFFALTFITFILSAITGFYQWRGYISNITVLILLGSGIYIGARSEDRWSFALRLKYLSYYWIWCCVAIAIVFIIAVVYVFLFPNRYINYCSGRECSTSAVILIMISLTAILMVMVWLVLVLFYIDIISRCVIIAGRFGDSWKHLSGIQYRVHMSCYKFRRIWKSLRYCVSRNTGLRMDDLLYCGCWMIPCQRKQHRNRKRVVVPKKEQKEESKEKVQQKRRNSGRMYYEDDRWDDDDFFAWHPVNRGHVADYEMRFKCCRGVRLGCCQQPPPPNPNRASYDASGKVKCNLRCGECNNCRCDICKCICGVCKDCEQCCAGFWGGMEECCHGCCECASSCCGSVIHHGTKCNCECLSCSGGHYSNAMDCDCSSCSRCDCDIGDCDGGGELLLVILACACVIIILLLPLIVYALLAAPFWLLAQYIVSKFSSGRSFWIVVLTFICALIPPFIIWYLFWGLICDGNDSEGFMQIMCFLWNIINIVVE